MLLGTTGFAELLRAASAPLLLISAVGLLLLSLVNRFNHALDRTRQLAREVEQGGGGSRRVQLAVLRLRALLLKRSIGFLLSTVGGTSLMTCLNLAQEWTGWRLDLACSALLVVSLGCLCLSVSLFFVDVRLSLVAIDLELGREPEGRLAKRVVAEARREIGERQ